MSEKKLNEGEEAFALHCRADKLTVEREYRFSPDRKWRFDFCFPDEKLGVEIEGGIWSGGRHTHPLGYTMDMEKYNEAVLLGFAVLRFTPESAKSGRAIEVVKNFLALVRSERKLMKQIDNLISSAEKSEGL